jgi:hypothetical protein
MVNAVAPNMAADLACLQGQSYPINPMSLPVLNVRRVEWCGYSTVRREGQDSESHQGRECEGLAHQSLMKECQTTSMEAPRIKHRQSTNDTIQYNTIQTTTSLTTQYDKHWGDTTTAERSSNDKRSHDTLIHSGIGIFSNTVTVHTKSAALYTPPCRYQISTALVRSYEWVPGRRARPDRRAQRVRECDTADNAAGPQAFDWFDALSKAKLVAYRYWHYHFCRFSAILWRCSAHKSIGLFSIFDQEERASWNCSCCWRYGFFTVVPAPEKWHWPIIDNTTNIKILIWYRVFACCGIPTIGTASSSSGDTTVAGHSIMVTPSSLDSFVWFFWAPGLC